MSYLKSDLRGLLEVLHKLSKETFKENSLNITDYSTLPSLTSAIFTSSFYDEKNPIKMIKGKIEEDIRQSYFGGRRSSEQVGVYANEVSKAYMSAIHSQYPKAMLNDMPVGDPIFTTEKDLDKIFGFVYGTITAPDADKLRVPYIQYRDPITGNVSCPRGEFVRMIFSEEMKAARLDGYKIEIMFGYQFERGQFGLGGSSAGK